MNYPLVGAFVLALGAVLVAVVLWLASGGAFLKKYDNYQAIEDESVAGLNLNAPVKFNGVEVGKVRSIDLDPVNPERVRLVLAIVRGTPIKQDTLAVLKTQGLTGISYIELDGGTRAAGALVPGDDGNMPMIRTKPSLTARLEDVVSNVLTKLDNTTNNLNAMLSADNRKAVTTTLADLASVMRTVAERNKTIDSAIANAGRTFDNSAKLTAQLNSQLTPALNSTLAKVDRAAAAIDRMGTDVSATSVKAGKTVDSVGTDLRRFSSDTLPELERLLRELSALSNSLRRFSETLERNPAGLLSGPSPVEPGPGESATAATPASNKGSKP